jgi:hypothetical protein
VTAYQNHRVGWSSSQWPVASPSHTDGHPHRLWSSWDKGTADRGLKGDRMTESAPHRPRCLRSVHNCTFSSVDHPAENRQQPFCQGF